MNVFFDNLNLVLRKYMQENSINLIIDKKNVIMADNKNNISKEILELMNNYE
jgi:Skp family chaperone for outer membrane proteins